MSALSRAQLWLVPPSRAGPLRASPPPSPALAGTASGLPPPGSLPKCLVGVEGFPGFSRSTPGGLSGDDVEASCWGSAPWIAPALPFPGSRLKGSSLLRVPPCHAAAHGGSVTSHPLGLAFEASRWDLCFPLQLHLQPLPNMDPVLQPQNMAAVMALDSRPFHSTSPLRRPVRRWDRDCEPSSEGANKSEGDWAPCCVPRCQDLNLGLRALTSRSSFGTAISHTFSFS